jgi:hypothetical protein
MIVNIAPNADPAYAEANAQPMVSWRNLLREGTIADANLPTSAPRQNAVEEDTVSFWAPNAGATFRSTLSAPATASVGFIAGRDIAGKTFGFQFFNGTTWITLVSVTKTDNQPALVVFPDTTASGFGVFTDDACEVSNLWIGPRIVIPGGVQPGYRTVKAARSVEKLPGRTNRGQWLGQRIGNITAELQANLMPLDRSFIDTQLADFRTRYTEGRAFLWAPAPGVYDDAAYCWAESGTQFGDTPLAGGRLCDLTLTMRAYCER